MALADGDAEAQEDPVPAQALVPLDSDLAHDLGRRGYRDEQERGRHGPEPQSLDAGSLHNTPPLVSQTGMLAHGSYPVNEKFFGGTPSLERSYAAETD